MNKIVKTEIGEYELIKNYRDAFNEESFISKCTDYFKDFDYIVGDIAYGKLRLKGFYDSDNKKVKKINDYKYLDKYLEEDCATECKYFILKKINNEQ